MKTIKNNKKFKVLVLTDHTTHQEGESIYPLLRTMAKNKFCSSIEVASRGNPENKSFFHNNSDIRVTTVKVDENFIYQKNGNLFLHNRIKTSITNFDLVFLRIDRPVPNSFFEFLNSTFPEKMIINRPSGIRLTGSKEFLLNFPNLCPPMKLCYTIEDVENFRAKFPIVLKPSLSFGGKGIIRIDGDKAWQENKAISFDDLKHILSKHMSQKGPYLAMKFLPNVVKGDKRIIVVNGKILGAILRIPMQGSWICNLSMGASAHYAEPDSDEIEIAKALSQKILKEGVVIFGFDTLINDEGRRVLSEINTLNVGGLHEAELYSCRPIIQMASDLIWDYIIKEVIHSKPSAIISQSITIG